ncbi:PEP-CTERM sorting domain-containing protein [Rhodanobacter denitrificans]|uniref:PEP-CTERM sorting domain-containing protein n=1 Tax=Rhodanobacter denitrificans TaxID=666685 RepID=A0A368KA13_9GAMM|nr:PEP-CTERM sorting domain-containing protein [Rhodanobacter denitrificans]RCS28779.1 PEP-CTERM sorting domain-containing protein [Rhodanobacter denitrificans]
MSKLSTLFLKRLMPFGLAASLAAVLLTPGAANATPYVVKLVQQGTNVVTTGSGAIDLTGLTFEYGTVTGGATLWPSSGFVMTGPQTSVALDTYTGFAGPTSFGSGNVVAPNVNTGDTVGIFGSPSYYGVRNLWVPSGYVSGDALFGTSTYFNASFASLGVTPGTFVWTWGTGADQSFTLDIAVNTPEPAALGMFGFGVLLIGAFVGRRRRTA